MARRDPLPVLLGLGALGLGGYALLRPRVTETQAAAVQAATAAISPTDDSGRESTGAAPTSGNPATAGPNVITADETAREIDKFLSLVGTCRTIHGRTVGEPAPYENGDVVVMRKGSGTTRVRFVRYRARTCEAQWIADDVPGSPRFEIPWDRRPTDFDLAKLLGLVELSDPRDAGLIFDEIQTETFSLVGGDLVAGLIGWFR